MLRVASSNDCPKIGSLSMRRHATSSVEADEMFAQNADGRVIPVDTNSMPFMELQADIPEDEQPILKRFRAGEAFKLSVYNFSANPEVPFVGFSIERASDGQDILVEGSKTVIDPSKALMTKPAIATIPLLHIFNEQIQAEAKRAADLIAKASNPGGVVSLSEERDVRMMNDALTATHNVMVALHGSDEPKAIEQPITGTDCLTSTLEQTLDASESFYMALMDKARKIFEPSIRTLAESVALGRFDASKTAPVRTV
jgi:hypothetical protein